MFDILYLRALSFIYQYPLQIETDSCLSMFHLITAKTLSILITANNLVMTTCEEVV